MKRTSKLKPAIGRIATISTDARLLNLVQLNPSSTFFFFLKQCSLSEVGKGKVKVKAELGRIKEKELTTDLGISFNYANLN